MEHLIAKSIDAFDHGLEKFMSCTLQRSISGTDMAEFIKGMVDCSVNNTCLSMIDPNSLVMAGAQKTTGGLGVKHVPRRIVVRNEGGYIVGRIDLDKPVGEYVFSKLATGYGVRALNYCKVVVNHGDLSVASHSRYLEELTKLSYDVYCESIKD